MPSQFVLSYNFSKFLNYRLCQFHPNFFHWLPHFKEVFKMKEASTEVSSNFLFGQSIRIPYLNGTLHLVSLLTHFTIDLPA